MENWLLASKYLIDQREHFKVLGDKYKRYSVDSEEEVCIPIKLKKNS
ncbi:MAG: AraC family transcriptional regulator [Litorivivens sp.]|jgi:AraC family transcriptional regulator